MGEISIQHGCVTLLENGRSTVLSAEEIFSVVFEGTSTLHGISLSREHFLSTGLDFRAYAADPTVVLQTASEVGPSGIVCRLVAKGIGFEAEVATHAGHRLDYAVTSTTWMPVPPGTLQAAQVFLERLGLPQFGPISLGQYLQILKTRDSALFIEDRTHEAFSATHLSETLSGEVPLGFVGALYPYQTAGYRWLAYMRRNALGCLIADEMGLGKTVQVICLLLDAKKDERVPCLVITPATLLENWRREIRRFAPVLDVRLHRGAHRTGFPDDLRASDVVLCSYETAVADISLLNNLTWDILVIDEAQAIKNPMAKRTRRLKTIPRACAVAMTGTPVENHLTDLWSITDFIVPSLLGSQAEFERRHPDTLDGATALEPILTPVILRRRVADVAKDLPERIDIPQPIELDDESATVYETLRQTTAANGHATLATLVKLRMFCTHPWLADQFTHLPSAADCSVKLQRLLEIMEEIVGAGGKTLVFTSYQGSVDLLAHEIAAQFGIVATSIDGRTPVDDRQPAVDRFSALSGPAALVLNPKAAGTGLNITAANHVIHFNLEWNPAVEDQATARAHRRGQKRTVTVHRLYYINTVEDVINDRMDRKRELAASAVVGTEGGEPDMQDILRALRVSPMNRQRNAQ